MGSTVPKRLIPAPATGITGKMGMGVFVIAKDLWPGNDAKLAAEPGE